MKVDINRKMIEHVAQVARLKLTEKEINGFVEELTEIIHAFSKLDEVDTKGIETSLQRLRVPRLEVGDLLINDHRRIARHTGEVEHERRLNLGENRILDPQRIHDHAIVVVELDEVHAPERGGVLILFATLQAQVKPFDLIGEVGNVILTEGESEKIGECGDHRNHERGGGTET